MILFGKENKQFYTGRLRRFLTGLLGTNHYGQQARMNRLWRITGNRLKAGADLLELGAYYGDFSFHACTSGHSRVDMVEIDNGLCGRLEKKFIHAPHGIYCHDVEQFRPPKQYDFIFLIDVTQYLAAPAQTLSGLMTALNKSGCLFFTLPQVKAGTQQGYTHEVVKNIQNEGEILAGVKERTGFAFESRCIYSALDERLERLHKKIKRVNDTLGLICLPLLLAMSNLRRGNGAQVYVVQRTD